MSEWGGDADDDSDREEELRQRTEKRKRKSNAGIIDDDEEEYDGDGDSGHPDACAPAVDVGVDSSSVYSSVMAFVAAAERANNTRPSDTTTPTPTPIPVPVPGRGVTPDLATQPFYIDKATLHAHQMSALNWIKARFEMGVSAILADEMGLGKTLTAISFLAYLQEISGARSHTAAAPASSVTSPSASSPPSRVGPFLIVCPLTVLDNWLSELSNFCPTLLVHAYVGSKHEREEMQADMRDEIRKQPKEQRRDPKLPFHILLTTYESIINDAEFLSKFRWRVGIIDEAHRLKNSESMLTTTLLNEYSIEWKLLLTGTPLQNVLAEIWSLLHFIQPKVFTDKKKFVQEFQPLEYGPTNHAPAAASSSSAARQVDHAASLDRLHSMLRPFMLRRMKEEVALDIPPKREIILRTSLTRVQKEIYKNLLLKNFHLIGGSNGQSGAGSSRSLLNIVQSLRKCTSHPYLFPGVEKEPFEEGPHLIQAAGKFRVLERILKVCKRLGRRVLLFSTSVQTLDVVQDALSYLKYTYERLDGSVRGEERYMAIERFSKKRDAGEEETFVFLLSTRAGGVGLNLTCADTVIFLDSDWNPQMDLQAQARAHRIGQRRDVLVIRLVASDTVDEIIQRRTMKKLLMTHNILTKGQFHKTKHTGSDDNSASVDEQESIGRSANDLKNILQYGLERLFGDASHAAAADDTGVADDDDLQEDEIEAIMTGRVDRTTHTPAATSNVPPAATPLKADEPAPMAIDGDSSIASARAGYNRIASVALPSLDDAPSVLSDAEPSFYVFEGTDFKDRHTAPADEYDLDTLDDQLRASAQAGSRALQEMFDHAKASHIELYDNDDVALDADGFASLTDSGRKRKAVDQESAEERAARLQRNRDIAAKRLEAARRKQEDAELARQIALQEKWAEHEYKSAAIDLDEAIEEQFRDEADSIGLESTQVTESQVEEWGANDDDQDESKETTRAQPHTDKKARLHYVIGDATRPFVFEREDGPDAGDASPSSSTSTGVAAAASAVVFIPVDASGRWGKGGLFRALDNRSSLIGEQYELIGEMDDLAMSDVHILHIAADQLRRAESGVTPNHDLQVAIACVLKRAKNQQYGPPALQAESLAIAFKKLSQYAARHHLSVHLPRIGGGDGNLHWYSIERMLQRYLVGRGLDVYVYYFQRRRPQYRSPVKTQLARANSAFAQRSMANDTTNYDQTQQQPNNNQTNLNQRFNTSATPIKQLSVARPPPAAIVIDPDEIDDNSQSGQATSPQLSILSQFHDVFTNCVIFIHTGAASSLAPASASAPPLVSPSISASDERLLSRFIAAYDGTVSKSIHSKVTHIVTGEPFLTPELTSLKQAASARVRVMQLAWVEQCVANGRLDDSIRLQCNTQPN